MNSTLLNEQYIINNILNNLHENVDKDLYIKEIRKIIRDEILQEGIKEVFQSKKFWRAIALATTVVVGANITAGFVAKKMHIPGVKDMVYHSGSGGDLLTFKTSDTQEGLDALKETEALYRGVVKIDQSTFKPVEDLALKADAFEDEWNSIKDHPVLRAIYIATIFKIPKAGARLNVIQYKDKDDLMRQLSNLDVTDFGYADKAWKMAQKQKRVHKKGNILYLSFTSPWCGGFAGAMLMEGHGLPAGAVTSIGGNQGYGNYMSKHASKKMFIHDKKKVLDTKKLVYKRKLVPGAILQVGKKAGVWGKHFITILGIGFESDGRMFIITAEGNTAPETGMQAVVLGIQELIDAYTGIDKSGTKYDKHGKVIATTEGSFIESFFHVAGGHAGGAGRTVSGKKRYIDELDIITITLPLYSQKIVGETEKFYKGLESQAKKFTTKEKAERKSKKKAVKKAARKERRKARRKNRKRQNSSYNPEGNILFEYTQSFLNNYKKY